MFLQVLLVARLLAVHLLAVRLVEMEQRRHRRQVVDFLHQVVIGPHQRRPHRVPVVDLQVRPLVEDRLVHQ